MRFIIVVWQLTLRSSISLVFYQAMCHHIHNLLDSYSKYNNKFSSTCQNAQICDFLRSTQFSRQTHSKIQKINGP